MNVVHINFVVFSKCNSFDQRMICTVTLQLTQDKSMARDEITTRLNLYQKESKSNLDCVYADVLRHSHL